MEWPAPDMPVLETERLILRPFEERDRRAFAALSADPEVMRYFPATRTIEEGNTHLDRILRGELADQIFMQAAELKATGEFIGFIGLNRFADPLREAIRGHPEIEVGWRLHTRFWGQGLAPEGARAWLAFGFETMELHEIVAITFKGNLPSRRVMEKLGMTYDPQGDFNHPTIAPGHPIRPHVLYRLPRPTV